MNTLEFTFQDFDKLQEARLSFVQQIALFFPIESDYQLGEEYTVQLTLPLGDTLTLSGKVVWVTPDTGKVMWFSPENTSSEYTQPGVGIQFSADAAKQLEPYFSITRRVLVFNLLSSSL